ncbi:class I adenylate-forming enzyme family protein [Salinisphaera sp. T31B1]|uniref:class I adenylate-forming enzyme family protein n=1 Tax=Salinisphaera sp. T31B1 TaxID=727963 RepID=UPI003341488F
MPESTLIAAYRHLWTSDDWRDREALASDDLTLSYAELQHRVHTLAGALVAAGLQPGEVVALSMARTGDSVCVLLAILFAGGSVCPLEPRLSAEEVGARLTRIGCRRAVTDTTLVHQFAHMTDIDVVDRIKLNGTDGPGAPEDRVGPDTPALTLFTSGSTGTPKAVQLTHRALANNAFGLIRHTGLTRSDRLLHVMPIYHTNGINNQILAPLAAGARIAFAPRFRAADMPELMARYQPTLVSGVPTMYSRMLAYSFDDRATAHLRMIRCGSAPITPDLHRRIEAALGAPVVVSYGLSEATCTSTMNPPDDRRIGSVGTTLVNQTVALLKTDADERVGAGQQGEIAIAGDNLMTGYLDENGRPDASVIASGWLRTGDLGRFDDDGYLFITGRIKDVIIRGGENIPPGMIEDVVTAHAGVEACCVVGQPDEDLGEVPVMFVVAAGDQSPSAQDLIDRVETQLSRAHRPAAVWFVDSLPENAVGKVDRKTLARRVVEQSEGAATS